jgi:hypothetical protein
VADRYFSPAEVEALIPALTEIMARLMAAHRETGESRERLQEEQRRIAMSGGGMLDAGAWRADKDRLERLGAEIEKDLREIAGLGGTTKDLGMGLVDFPHLRDGHEVNLCWRHGERRIGFWHALDEGYTRRKPL